MLSYFVSVQTASKRFVIGQINFIKAASKLLNFCAANFDWNGKRQQTCMRVLPSIKICHIPFLGVAVFSEPKNVQVRIASICS